MAKISTACRAGQRYTVLGSVTGEQLEATPTVPTWAVGTSPKSLSWAYSRTSSQDPGYCWDILARPENQLVLRNLSLPGASH